MYARGWVREDSDELPARENMMTRPKNVQHSIEQVTKHSPANAQFVVQYIEELEEKLHVADLLILDLETKVEVLEAERDSAVRLETATQQKLAETSELLLQAQVRSAELEAERDQLDAQLATVQGQLDEANSYVARIIEG